MVMNRGYFMNKVLRKVLGILLVGAVLLSFIGCGLRDKNASKSNSESSEAITLTVWHLWTTEADGNAVSFSKALELYKREHPNVTVEIDATENEAYKTKIKTAMATNEAPDIFFSWGAGFAQPFVNAGKVLPLEKYLPVDALKNLNRNETSNFTYQGSLYGLPFVSWLGVLYCNQEMFDKVGVKVPDTMDELYTAINAFKAENIVPIAVGAKDAWNAVFYHNVATMRTAGVKASTQALLGEVSYNQPEFLAGAQIVTDLIQAGAFDPSALAYTYDEAKLTFLNGEAPMMFMGSWLAGEIQNKELSLVTDKVVAKNFPTIVGGKYNGEFLGGAIDGLMVNANTKHKEVAAEFVAFITEKMARESFLEGAGLPTWQVDVSGETIDPLVQQIVELSHQSEGKILAWDTFLSGADVATHLFLVQEIFAGTKTPKEFVEGMEMLK